MLVTALIATIAAMVAVTGFAAWLHRESGPVIVTLAAVGFLLSLVRRRA